MRTSEWGRNNPERRRQHRLDEIARDPERIRSRAREAQARRRAKLATLRRDEFAGDPCVHCGGTATTVDHIRPVNRGGADHASNKAPSCLPCNQEKGDNDLLQFLLIRQGRTSTLTDRTDQ